MGIVKKFYDENVLNQFNKTAEFIAKKNLEKCNIKFLNYAEVVIVTSNYVLLKDGRKIFCKLPILATNSGPLDLLRKSDLPLTKNGSILIESNLLVSGYNNIFSTGDISEIKAYNMPKAGVFAVKQGKILVKNIKKLYLQKKLSLYKPQKYFLLEFYEKPTTERKRKAAAAVKRHAKKIQREQRRRERLY